MKVSLLDALAVVPLRVGQAKKALFEKGASSRSAGWPEQWYHRTQLALLLLVPESKGDVLVAVGVANARNAVLAPSVCARPGVIVGEV
jgi:hypothetical protein